MAFFVCDDSQVIREVVKNTFKAHGYANKQIIEAKDGKDALEKIKAHHQDIELYILDINMPHKDGISLIDDIRPLSNDTPIILLTTETNIDKMSSAKEKGATGWVVKPFDAEKFITIVDSFIK